MVTAMLLQAPHWCPWCSDHMGTGWGWFMMIFWVILLIVVVVVGVGYLRRSGTRGDGAARPGDDAEATLRERYARGEIDEETYRRMRNELREP
jgi:putative membrane protein